MATVVSRYALESLVAGTSDEDPVAEDLVEGQFYEGLAVEDAHRHFELPLLGVDLDNRSRQCRKWPIQDAH
ncbi:MAG: hypothetical protein KDI64_22385, partial [Candidatus Accumulibacter sp.]|nr:hypothetical protein [Accumulibacter sp.]